LNELLAWVGTSVSQLARIFVEFERFVKKKSVAFRVGDNP